MRKDEIMSRHIESGMQIAFINWCNWNVSRYPELNYIHHSPNGGKRSAKEAARFKKEGVKPGFPDLILPVPRGCFNSLYIELKTEKGKLTENQIRWIEFLRQNGNKVLVCRSVDECIRIVKEYLELEVRT